MTSDGLKIWWSSMRSLMYQALATFPAPFRYLLGSSYAAYYYRNFGLLTGYVMGQLATRGLATSDNVNKILTFRNRHAGQRCFVLGNGPSLKSTNLDLLKDEVTLASNGIFFLFDEGFKPTYYNVVDDIFAEEYSSEIDAIQEIPKFLSTSLKRYIKRTETPIWLNYLPTYIHGHHSQYKNLNFREDAPILPEFSNDLVVGIYDGGTVTYMMLQIAYYMGFREVYLIGVDHNYTLSSSQAESTDKENVLISVGDDLNHFHPDYFGKGRKWHDPKVRVMEKCYVKAKMFGDSHNFHIYNATVGGKLEIFPRVDYESLFA